jgi:hypothetical protein
MDHLGRVEYLPEPEDARILSAIDPAAVGFQGAWRAEVTGWAPLEAAPVHVDNERSLRMVSSSLCSFLPCSRYGIQGF